MSIFLVVRSSQLHYFRRKGPVLLSQKLVVALQVKVRSLVYIEVHYRLQLLKFFLLLSLDINHLNFILSFLCPNLFFQQLEFLLQIFVMLLCGTGFYRPIFSTSLSFTLL